MPWLDGESSFLENRKISLFRHFPDIEYFRAVCYDDNNDQARKRLETESSGAADRSKEV